MKPRKIDYERINRHSGQRLKDLPRRYLRLRDSPLAEDLEIYDPQDTRHPDTCFCDACHYDYRDDDFLRDAASQVRQKMRHYLHPTGQVTLASILPDAVQLALQASLLPRPSRVIPPKKYRIPSSLLAQSILAYAKSFSHERLEDFPMPQGLQAFLEGRRIQKLLPQLLDGPLQGNEKLLLDVLLLQPFWVRDLHTWRCDAAVASDVSRSLIDHLFVIYPVPSFFYQRWRLGRVAPDEAWVQWFLLAAQGASLYDAAPIMGWKIPPRFPHFLAQVPDDLSFEHACRYAEMLRLGLKNIRFEWIRHSHALILDPTSVHFQQSELEFSREMLLWLDQHYAAFQTRDLLFVLEWGRHLYTEAERRNLPRFSFAGRSPAPVLREVNAHVQARQNRNYPQVTWKETGWDWESTAGIENYWSFWELTSSKALYEEGLALRHCVASYLYYCISKRSAIFSVRLNGERRFTVEYDLQNQKVVQAKGKCNRNLLPAEQAILTSWQAFVQEISAVKSV